ncbi:hypothetical protein BC937DRAFT_86524 [Endogone sp. FLAS-F59071]|nr:hypothetical protein BC937DRAFT_86524 [Endogone sp. FLAS-F59071]|eukprot:RUS20039.1 hypothetical protein BC937DRAFT_86524 [Endogone sp. FLAS-F59071]
MAKLKSTTLCLLVLLTMAARIVAADLLTALSGHTATIANGVMHIIGGNTATTVSNTTVPTNSHYTLDLTQPFNTSSPPVAPVPGATSPTAPPPIAHHTSALRSDNSSFVIWGGGTSSNYTNLLDPEIIYIYWTGNNTWTTEPIPVGPKQRRYHTAVINSTDNTWFDIHGGVQDAQTGASAAATPVIQNTVWGCDTSAFTWSNLTASNVQLYQHSAIMLTNGHTIVLGGLQQYVADSSPSVAQAFASMNQIQFYDSIAGVWSTKTSSGETPPLRAGHSAVLTSENHILIYGGYGVDGQPLGDVYILDPSTLTWYQPNITGTAPNPRYFHTANYVNNQMIVVGGSGASNSIYNDVQVLSKVLGTTELASISSAYAWVNNFSPTGPSITVSNSPSSPTATASTPAKNAATERMSGITLVLLEVVIGLAIVVAF